MRPVSLAVNGTTSTAAASYADSQRDDALDARLLAAVATGDEEAFDRLRHRYWRAVERVCRSLPGEIEDCVQEVFLRVWRKASLFDATRGSAPAWLLTLARNVSRNLHATPRPTPTELDLEAPSPARDEVDRIWLHSALARIPAAERTVIELAYFADRSQSQIARELNVPLGTVKSWNRRGLNHLAELLAETDT